MSWQRIDDNTYIDNSLVTCTEYQLFIDEMREQGMLYQPDHWTSYLFPNGQAREPILGVRYSDAVAFCRWLTHQGNGEWKYRLPSQNERNDYPIKLGTLTPLGYWIIGTDNQSQFVWISDVSVDTRMLNFAITKALNYQGIAVLGRVLNYALLRGLKLDRAHALDVGSELAAVINRILDRALDTERTREFATATYAAVKSLRNTPNQSLDYLANYSVLDLYIDLFTLQERIGGRAPAFEGIRIVRERVRQLLTSEA